MTTQQVASRYYEMARQQQWAAIQQEMYSKDIVNKEPEHALTLGIPTVTKGLDAVIAKGEARRALIEKIHGQSCSEPVTGAGYFSVSMSRDITFKGQPRKTLEEIAVFEVKDGKIVTEQFFY